MGWWNLQLGEANSSVMLENLADLRVNNIKNLTKLTTRFIRSRCHWNDVSSCYKML